jgi:hypothetical protein
MRSVEARRLMLAAAAALQPADTVLDIGCGIRPQTVVAPRAHVCCEPFAQYVDVIRTRRDLIVVQASWAEAVDAFPPESFDTVLLVDVIEHLDRQTGENLLPRTLALARNQVAVFTPIGDMPQLHPDGKDAWGLDGGMWQEHRSGWTPSDFGGWDIISCPDFHRADVHGNPLDPPIGAFWAIKTKAPCSVGALRRLAQYSHVMRLRLRG